MEQSGVHGETGGATVADKKGSTVQSRQLGRSLAKARDVTGMSLDDAATELEWSKTTQWRIERGFSVPRSHDVRLMCKLYGVDSDMEEALVALAHQADAEGWWHSYSEMPQWFQLYVDMEATACRLRQYEGGLIPGLLQIEPYAEAILRQRHDMTDKQIAEGVAVRMTRQRLLTRRAPQSPEMVFILDEAVLWRPIADTRAMREQLAHLARVAVTRSSRISLRVVPSHVGPHRGCHAGAFVIMEFPAPPGGEPEPTTVYCECLTGALYLDKPGEVGTYNEVWGQLDGLALSAAESAEVIETITKEI